MLGSGVVKSWVAAAVLAASLAPLAAALRTMAHACSDHVCLCAGPSRVGRSATCHDGRPPGRPDCQMRSGCRHDTTLGMSAAPLYLAPSTDDALALPRANTIGAAGARRPLAGVLRIDSPPPRRA